jgi:hypothetical protein
MSRQRLQEAGHARGKNVEETLVAMQNTQVIDEYMF